MAEINVSGETCQELVGSCISVRLITDQVEVALLPDHNLDAERRRNHETIFVGSLELYDNKMAGLIPIPMDALAPILARLIGDRFKFLAMSGTELYRRSIRLTGFSLEMTMEEEEPSGV
jgi:hypothetical protein